MKVLVLVDGEHYPPVTRWAIASARAAGHEVVAALLVGGTEKLAADRVPDLGVEVRTVGPNAAAALGVALDELMPEAVLDLSDEPVLGYRERMELAAVALAYGVPYLGSDFRLDPPISGPPLPAPTLAVHGTGKRTGKTAIAGEVARVAAGLGLEPVVVAMGRGGPAAPQVAEAGSVTVEVLLDLVRRGQHAASDYLEDAVTTGVTTIGARRAAGGLAGAPYVSSVRPAAELAVARGAGIVVLEGSGSSIPPVPWDAGILVVPATVPPEYVGGYLGPFRLLLSDVVVVTMARSPAGLENLPTLRSHVQRLRNDTRFIVTEFEPLPLGDVRGRDVFFATTARGRWPPDRSSTWRRPTVPRGGLECQSGRPSRAGQGHGRCARIRRAPDRVEGGRRRRGVRPGARQGSRGRVLRQPRRRGRRGSRGPHGGDTAGDTAGEGATRTTAVGTR
jgi:cyclic 2,3-diphosphoglycerate synthetase